MKIESERPPKALFFAANRAYLQIRIIIVTENNDTSLFSGYARYAAKNRTFGLDFHTPLCIKKYRMEYISKAIQ